MAKEEKIEILKIIALIMLLEVFFFRNIFFNDALLGNNGDVRFINMILEHWFRVITDHRSQISILDFNMFYPVKGVLAYSDLLLGFVPFYSVFRFLNIDIYTAGKWTMILVHFIGTLSTFFLLYQKFEMKKSSSIIGTVIFVYSNNQNIIGHPQMFAVYFVPIFLIFFIDLYKKVIKEDKKILNSGICSIISFALIFYTAGYVGYFLFILIFILLIFTYVYNLFSKKLTVDKTIKYISENYTSILFLMVLGIVIFIPFIYIYFPVSKMFGKRTWEEIIIYLPNITDIINIPDTNMFFGGIFDLKYGTHAYEELSIGFPLITAVLWILSSVFIIKNFKNKNEKLIFSLAITILLITITIIKIDHSKSLWWLVYMWIPGIGSLRVVNRFWHLLSLPIGIIIAFYIENKNIKNIILHRVFILIVLLQYIWIGGVSSSWKVHEALEKINGVSMPPNDCEIMYIVKQKKNENEHFTISQLDGIEIANRFSLDTINGYNSFYPVGWEVLNNMYEKDYEVNMYTWIRANDLKNVYAYYFEDDQWVKIKNFPKTELVSENIPNRNVIFIEDSLSMRENSLIFGPYFSLSPGKYKIEVKGENIDLPQIYSTYNKGKNMILLNVNYINKNFMEFEFELFNLSNDWEFIVENNSETIVNISSIKLSCVEEY